MIDKNSLPGHWKSVRLGDYAKTEKGKKPKLVSDRRTEKCSIPYINIKAFEKNIIDEFTDGAGCVICEDDDFLMVWDGSRSGYVGKAKKGALGSTLVRIKLPEIDHNYAYYFLQSKFIEINTKAKGVGIPHVDPNLVWNYILPLPPLHEQHQIVSKIEELFSELDKGKQQLETVRQQLKTYRQAVLKWAFEGKLTENWRLSHNNLKSSTDFLKEVSESRKKKFIEIRKRGEKIIEKNIDFEFKQSSEIKSWVEAKLDNLIYIAGRIGWRGLTKAEYKDSGPLFLSVHSLNYGKYVEFKDAYHISQERFKESPEIILMDKDILLCKDGAGIGKIGIVNGLTTEATINSSLLIIRGLEIFIPEFLYYLLSGPKLQLIVQERITGSATPHLFQNDIRKFDLLIPPLEEQKQIILEIESRLSVCDKMEDIIETSLKQAESLRQSILKQAFEGKLIILNK